MSEKITRRLSALESRRRLHHTRRFLLMPWDLEPDAGPDDMVIRISFIRPTDRFGGEPVPYIRTGINPAEDDPNSHNGRLHRESAGDHPWTSRTYPTGTTITLPHNDREPLEGGPYA